MMGKLWQAPSTRVRLEKSPGPGLLGQPADVWLCVGSCIGHSEKVAKMVLNSNTNNHEKTKKMNKEGQVCFFGYIFFGADKRREIFIFR